MNQNPTFFIPFQKDISGIALPKKFTFPFFYEPHILSKIATEELQYYLENQTDFEHHFGIDNYKKETPIGKMFGVLVVQNQELELGYLAAFSGKLAESNQHKKFVPPVFDMLTNDSFFLEEEQKINRINKAIEDLEKDKLFQKAKENITITEEKAKQDLSELKKTHTENKKKRDALRKNVSENEAENLQKILSEQSIFEKIEWRNRVRYWEHITKTSVAEFTVFKTQLENLKQERKTLSANLQQRLFEQYTFFNQNKEAKSLASIFANNPPAGAGECAAPKLLHYAFQHHLQPIAMAEFWWGASPKSEVRKHQHFYAACTGKCEPILKHMLQNIPLEENPFLHHFGKDIEIETLFEDDYLAVINKPAEFLSVPGKSVNDSVATRMQKKYPNASGPLVVHRLDMSTSGVMLIAKTMEIYKKLQSQFIKRTVKKRYVAVLEGIIKKKEGKIILPLRVDLNNRPNQLVCFEHGKNAETHYKVVEEKEGKTKIHFYPITGRTHQLRMHASHVLGLNCAILGDDLYGTKANRLHLHAESITFEHPITKEKITISKEADF